MTNPKESAVNKPASHAKEVTRRPGLRRGLPARISATEDDRCAPVGRNAIAVALAAVFSTAMAHAQLPESKEMIDRFDKNGDTALNISELEDAIEWMQQKHEKPLAIQNILMLQWDNDENDKISRAELDAGMDSLSASESAEKGGASSSQSSGGPSQSTKESGGSSGSTKQKGSTTSSDEGSKSQYDRSSSSGEESTSSQKSTSQGASPMDRKRTQDDGNSGDSDEADTNRVTTATAAQSARRGERSNAGARDKSTSQARTVDRKAETGDRRASSDRRATSKDQSETQMSKEEIRQLEGEAVYTTQGVEIGSIDKIVADKDTGSPYVVVSRNMYFTAGDEQFALAVEELEQKNDLLTATGVSGSADMEERNYDASAFEAFDEGSAGKQQDRGRAKEQRGDAQQRGDARSADDAAAPKSERGKQAGRNEAPDKEADATASSPAAEKDRESSQTVASRRTAEANSAATRSSGRLATQDDRGQEQQRTNYERTRPQSGYEQRAENRRVNAQRANPDDTSAEAQKKPMELDKLVFVAPEELVGMTIVDGDGRTIGEVEDVVLKKGDENLNFFLVTSSDVFLGLGNDDSVIAIEEIRRDGDRLVLSSVDNTAIFIPEDYLRIESVE